MNAFYLASLATLFGYGVGWLPLAFPLVQFAVTLLLVFKARLNRELSVFPPPGMLPLLLLALLPLTQLIPFPPQVLKIAFPEIWSLYGETIWLADPGVWMPASPYPKATLNAFFFLALNIAVYLLTANLLREKRRLEKTVATLTVFAAVLVFASAVAQIYTFFSAGGQALPPRSLWSAGLPGKLNLRILLVTLFPVLLLFAGYRFSRLRHYPLREKVAEIFDRKSWGGTGSATTTVSLLLLSIYMALDSSPLACAVSAVALIFCGLQLFLNRGRRTLSRPAFIAGFFFCLIAILTGIPSLKKSIDNKNRPITGPELRLLPHAGVASRLLVAAPVLGTGLGTGQRVRSRLAEDGEVAATQEKIAVPADLAIGAGMAGVFLGGWFLVSLLRRTGGRRKEQKSRLDDCLLAASLAGLLAFAVFFVSGCLPVAASPWAFFLAGLAVSVASPQGARGEAIEAAAGISAKASKAGTLLVVLIAATCGLSTLGAQVGKSRHHEARQFRDGWEESNLDSVVLTSLAKNAEKLDPLEGRYFFAQAELWLASGNFPEARKQFVAALHRDPLNGKYLQSLGRLQALDGSAAKGEQLILAGLGDKSALHERQQFYAGWLAASARTDEALQVVREGLTQAPGQTRSFLQKMVLEGIPLRELRQALPNRSRCFIDYADYQRESGDFGGAAESYRMALGLATGERHADPSIFWRLYHYFSGEGNDTAALAALQGGLRLFPTNTDLRRLSGDAYKSLGIRIRAAEEYRMALLGDPENQDARRGLEEVTAE